MGAVSSSAIFDRLPLDKFGLELTIKAHEDGIEVKRDKIAIILHWCLLRKGLKFGGFGTDFTDEDDINLSELLPSKWNSSDFTWKYREKNNKPNKFILNISQNDREILNVTLVRLSDEKSQNFSVDLKKEVYHDFYCAEKFPLVREDHFLQQAYSALLKDFFPDSFIWT